MADSAAELAETIPSLTVARLTQYLRCLHELQAAGVERVSSEGLAEASGEKSSTVRKDLSYLGTRGTPGVGYEVPLLRQSIEQALGLHQEWRVAIIGSGNLGRALGRYAGFESRGFSVVALFDEDPEVVGQYVGGLQVTAMDGLESVLTETRANMAVLTVPEISAQQVCDRVVEAGIPSILSFAPTGLNVPEGVTLRKVDMATELQILAYHASAAQGAGAAHSAGAIPS